MLVEALLDLARLLVCVNVQRQSLVFGVAADLPEPVGRAGADGVGGEADPDAAPAQVLDLIQVLGRGGLAEAREPASRIRGVEEHELDARGLGGFGRGQRLLEAEVVELADGGVAGRAHLAVDELVAGADALGGLLVRQGEHGVAPGPEVAALGTASQRALEGMAVRVDEAGNRQPVRHGRDRISLPVTSRCDTLGLVPMTSSPMRSYRARAHVSVAKDEQMSNNQSAALYP